MTRSIIASLAILKVNYEKRDKDFIDNFVPFVVECVRVSVNDVVSLPAIQSALKDEFSLAIPLNPLRQILQRAAKLGFLRRESGIFYRNREACDSTNFAAMREEVRVTEDRVIGALQKFALEIHSTELSDEEADASFLTFVADTGLDVLYASAEKSVVPKPSVSKGTGFIVADFVAHSQVNSPTLFNDVETIIKGALLANALYVPDQGRISARFKDTRVYLDTTFLIYLLGYGGTDRQAPCLELISLLKEYGAILRVFSQTIEELRGVLDACSGRIRRGQLRDAFGPAIEYFITEGLTSSDVDLLSARFPTRLPPLSILVEENPPFVEKYVIDESAFQAYLAAIVHYHNPKALQHDVDCIAAIARIRAGREAFSVETCRAIFLTTNSGLAKEARAFFQPDSSEGAVSFCISDYALGNLLWLKNPTKAPDLPQRILIADAYAAVQPSDDLWKSYLAEISRLDQSKQLAPEDYLLLRHSLSAKRALMDITKGEVTAFSEGTVSEILEVAKRNVRADLVQELSSEKAKRIQTETHLSSKEDADLKRLASIAAFASRVARVLSNFLFFIAVLALGTATLYTFPWELPSLVGSWLRYLIALLQIFLFAYTLSSIAWGTSLHHLASKLRDRLTTAIEGRIKAWLSF